VPGRPTPEPFEIRGKGVHQVTYLAIDKAGNRSEIKTAWVWRC
jgi:hypothetical protein